LIVSAGFHIGCADREDRPKAEADSALQQASAALDRAQAAMQKAGIDINFADVGSLSNLSAILPNPVELGLLEDQGTIQDAIGAMYEVLDAFGQNVAVAQAPANPAQAGELISKSDVALVHIHLAYLYVLEAVRILTRAGWGKDGQPATADDLFQITFPENVEVENLDEVYKFELTDRGQERFDRVEQTPGSRPEDYLREFRANERQTVLNALLLLAGAEVRVEAFPGVTDIDGQPITEQRPTISRSICRQNALFHLERAFDTALEIAPDLADAVNELNEIIAEAFAEDLLDQTLEWGFEVENEAEVRAQINRLISR
jgi:hypothetical protein